MFSKPRRSREFKSGDRSPNGFFNGSDSETVEESPRNAQSLKEEETRARKGKSEYKNQNYESALEILDGINLHSIFTRLKSLQPPPKAKQKRGKPPVDPPGITPSSSAELLEAAYIKIKSLEHLGRVTEATHECVTLMEHFHAVFPRGLPEHPGGTGAQKPVNKLVELLPELMKRVGMYPGAVSAYRRALIGHRPRGSGGFRRIQHGLAILLLYGGADEEEAAALRCPPGVYEDGFVPSGTAEEAVYLLVELMKGNGSREDPELIEHLCFALGTSGSFRFLAERYESLLPGLSSRTDRWFDLALCYTASEEKGVALNLLRKILGEFEKPDDPFSLLHASALICCSGGNTDVQEGVGYCRRAVELCEGSMGFLKGRAWHLLGLLLSIKARASGSSSERSLALKEALRSLYEAGKLEKLDPEVVFHSGLVNAEQGNLKIALESAKKFLEIAGASPRGWRFLALVLSAQQRFGQAEMIVDAALQETSHSEEMELLMTKAKLQVAREKESQALVTYKELLTLVRGFKGRVSELMVLQELAALSTSLSQLSEAERFLEKAMLLDPGSARTWSEYGSVFSAQGRSSEALSAFNTALSFDPEHVWSKIGIGSLLYKLGSSCFPVARSYLNDALRSNPKNSSAWFHLGVLHEAEDRLEQAAECFKTAFILDQSAPVEEFSTLLEGFSLD